MKWLGQGSDGKESSIRETQVQSLGWEDPLEKGKATHSSILAWWIPWTEESGGLQSMGSQRVRHDWVARPTHSAMTGVLIRKGEMGGDMRRGHVSWRQRQGWCRYKPSNTKEATRGWTRQKGILPSSLWGRITLLTPSLLTSSLHDCEKIHFCLFGWLLLATLGRMWDLSSLIRDWTHHPCNRSMEF